MQDCYHVVKLGLAKFSIIWLFFSFVSFFLFYKETICNRCIQNLLEKSKNFKYKCIICKNVHEIPENRHFPANKFISKISSEQPKEIYRSELVESLKGFFKLFDQNKQSMQKFLDDGIVIIKDQCSSVRKGILILFLFKFLFKIII